MGGGDGFCSNLVADCVNKLHVTDINQVLIDEFNLGIRKENMDYFYHDILIKPLDQKYDAIYSLDVLEHIPKSKEPTYLNNICASLNESGICIIGMPSLESQIYASADSKLGHVNCKTGEDLKKCLNKHFHQVSIFSMNDEMIHTGFYKMAHYLMALCCNPK